MEGFFWRSAAVVLISASNLRFYHESLIGCLQFFFAFSISWIGLILARVARDIALGA